MSNIIYKETEARETIGFQIQTTTGDGSTTIDWTKGNKFHFLFSASTPETFTFTAPSNPCNLILRMTQHSTGGQIPSWPATVKWAGGVAPAVSSGNDDVDIIGFYFDGTNYHGQIILNSS